MRRLTYLFRTVALLLGGLHAWAAMASHSMNSDGISYLDIGDAYLRGDWDIAVNTVWSPLYSWILGPVMAVFKPPMRWEFPLVHLVNFIIYAGTLFCFEFFWRQAWNALKDRIASDPNRITWPEWAWWSIGYLLFIWSSLTLIEIWAVTPDLLMAGLVYLAAGQLMRILRGSMGWKIYTSLGIFLGLGYLAKAIMFPVSFAFFGVALAAAEDLRLAFPRVLAALTAFSILTIPYILLISKTAGKFTTGEAGALTYARYVNGVPYPHWQGNPPGNGVPAHPSRQIFGRPAIYEFGSPIESTYPISLNPAYWYEGVETHFDLSQQLRLLTASLSFYLDLFFRQLGGLMAGGILLFILSRRSKFSLRGFVRSWGIAIPAWVGMALYALVLVEGRYVGAFVVLFLADLLRNISLPDAQSSKRLIAGTAGIIAFILLANLVMFNIQGLADFSRSQEGGESSSSHPPAWPGEVAEELQDLGIQPGDPVGVIGYAFDSFWARLARVRIVAEMLDADADPFWTGGPALQKEVIQAFTQAGGKAIIAESVPAYASLEGWHQVEDSNYFIFLIR
jgi:hypothetical protein